MSGACQFPNSQLPTPQLTPNAQLPTPGPRTKAAGWSMRCGRPYSIRSVSDRRELRSCWRSSCCCDEVSRRRRVSCRARTRVVAVVGAGGVRGQQQGQRRIVFRLRRILRRRESRARESLAGVDADLGRARGARGAVCPVAGGRVGDWDRRGLLSSAYPPSPRLRRTRRRELPADPRARRVRGAAALRVLQRPSRAHPLRRAARRRIRGADRRRRRRCSRAARRRSPELS